MMVSSIFRGKDRATALALSKRTQVSAAGRIRRIGRFGVTLDPSEIKGLDGPGANPA